MIFDKKRKEAWDCLPQDVKHKLRCYAKGAGWTERRCYATEDNFALPLYNVLTDIFGTYWRLDEIPTDEIKVGDIVRVKDDAPKDVWRNRIGAVNPSHYKGLPFEVTQIDDDGLERMAHLDSMNGFIHIYIPVRYLEPYYTAEDVRRMEEDLQREKEQHLREHSGKEANDPIKDIADIVEEYRKGFAKITSELVDFDWLQYRAELVKEFALKLIGGNEIKCLQNANYITDFATRIVDNLKKQEV